MGRIGLEPSLEDYIADLVAIFDQVRRVIRDDGTLWLNIGDSYTSGGKSEPPRHTDQILRFQSIRGRWTDIHATHWILLVRARHVLPPEV